MPLLEVSLPLDPLLFSNWAWLIALCLATVATFSRLSPFSSFMDSPPFSSFISSRHVKLHLQLASEEAPSSSEEGELTAPELNESVCEGQAGSVKENPWSSLHLPQCGAGEEDEKVEEEDGEEVHPPWVSALLEASRTQPEAFRNDLEASTPALEAPRACTSCVQATSWSQGLHRQISARVGIPWHCLETGVGMSLDHQATLPCTQNVSTKMRSCQELQMLQSLQVPNMQSTISAVEVGNRDGFTHVGYCNGEIALWDVEKKVCLNRLCDRESPVAALFAAPSYPRLAIATGWSAHNQACSIVSVWDDRSALCSGNFVVSMSARRMKALECRGHELGIAGDGYVTRHDLRMLKGDPIMLHAAESIGKSAWEGQGSKNRGTDYRKYEVKCVNDEVEEEADEFLVLDKMCSDYNYEGNHASNKRRCSLFISCLSFMCCLVQNP